MTVVTSKELAQAAGVTPGRVRQWVKEGLPRIGRNQYDSEAALAWIADRREDQVEQSGDDIKALRARLYKLQGDAQHLRNEVLRGNLVLSSTAEAEFRAAFAELVSIHDAWIAQGRNAEEQRRLTELSHAVRAASERAIDHVAATLARGEDVAATRVRYGRRVGG